MQKKQQRDYVTKLKCTDCNAILDIVDKYHANCPHCGQKYVIDAAGNIRVDVHMKYQNTKESKVAIGVAKWYLIIYLSIILLIGLGIFLQNVNAVNSEYSFLGDEAVKSPMKAFCEDVFDKAYEEITEEEFAKIKYIKYYSTRPDGVSEHLHLIEYSFMDYRDCANEQEFQETIYEWSCKTAGNQEYVGDLTMFTGLTRVYSGYLQYAKTADISYVEAGRDLKQLGENLDPSKVEVIIMDSCNNLDGLEVFNNLQELSIHPVYNVTNFDLSALAECETLKKLTIYSSEYSNWESIGKITGLESLNIPKKIEECDFLKNLKNLEQLNILCEENADLSVVSELPKLKELYLPLGGRFVVPASEIKYLQELEHLSIVLEYPEDLAEIAKIKNLKTLQVKICTKKDSKNKWFWEDRMSEERYHGEEVDCVVDLEVLSKLADLESFYLEIKKSNYSVKPIQGAEALLNAPQMKTFKINSPYQMESGRDNDYVVILEINPDLLVENASLETLQLVDCRVVDEESKREVERSFFTHYPNLKQLVADYCGLSDISFMRELAELRACSLAGNDIEDFSPLKACRLLGTLTVSDNPGKTEGLSEEIKIRND